MPKKPSLLTSDIGFVIRDFLQGQLALSNILLLRAPHDLIRISAVDMADPDNPIILTEGGNFRLNITKID